MKPNKLSVHKYAGLAFGSPRAQRGVSLMEILTASVILSIGLLGLASLHFEGLKKGNASFYKSMASIQADDLIDRMRANRDGVASGFYESAGQNVSASNLNCLGGVDNGGRSIDMQTADIIENVVETTTYDDGTLYNQDAVSGVMTTVLGVVTNPIDDDYIDDGTHNQPNSNGSMSDTSCNAQQLAQQDLFEFNQGLQNVLPGAQATVCRSNAPGAGSSVACNGQGNLMVIDISWTDKQGGRHSHRVTTKP